MSCNGCRILRKGCNENCILRQSLQGIESPQAQANATVFVAKFFGRAGLMSFLSSVPQPQRPALFQSLLFEACGRTVNPVNGAVGLLWTGNWHVCQSAVETVLRGGVLRSSPQFFSGQSSPEIDESWEGNDNNNNNNNNNNNDDDDDLYGTRDLNMRLKRKVIDQMGDNERIGLEIGAATKFTAKMTAGGRVNRRSEKRRLASPPSDESETTTLESGFVGQQDLLRNYGNGHETKLLRLFF